mmetsp:Transcript_19302/g.61848  ORF Transcript_19302/g.61848 Transcript_19302/m.61848 type:complete len:93 (+) Transcript_19302:2769-3047(+)
MYNCFRVPNAARLCAVSGSSHLRDPVANPARTIGSASKRVGLSDDSVEIPMAITSHAGVSAIIAHPKRRLSAASMIPAPRNLKPAPGRRYGG